MPYSKRDNDAEVLQYVDDHRIDVVLDVGAGAGTYGRLLRDRVTTVDAVEVWKPYVVEFALRDLYDTIYTCDVRDERFQAALLQHGPYDLIIFGDILEHMSTEDGQRVWAWARKVARHGLISVPTVHWPQGAINGNPFEEHVQDCIGPDDFEDAFGPFDVTHLYKKTATFFTEFS